MNRWQHWSLVKFAAMVIHIETTAGERLSIACDRAGHNHPQSLNLTTGEIKVIKPSDDIDIRHQ